MSKININFNNKTYNVDKESLSSATAELKNYLSTTMNGQGATINFDGTSYNIDSTKLASATNDFIAHIGTIFGNGHKITVGGVEYSISTDKVAGAVAGLETVLNRLNNPTETDNVAILDEAILDYATLA